MSSDKRYPFATLILASLLGCGGGGDGDVSTPVQTSGSSTSVTGAVSKGPLQGADVSLYEIDDNGDKLGAEPLATGVTDSQGRIIFETEVPAGPAYLVETSGGEYVDESDPATDKRRIQLLTGEGFVALVAPEASTVAVTPYSHALYARARLETHDGDFLAAFSRNRALFQQGVGVDVATTIPQDPTQPSASAPAAERRYALLLGGFANALNNAAIQLGMSEPSFQLLKAMLVDLRDGQMDGREGLGERIVVARFSPNESVLLPDNIDLNAEIRRFRNNNSAVYPDTSAQVNESTLSQAIVPSVSVGDTTAQEGADFTPRPGTVAGPAIRTNSGFSANVLPRNDDDSTSDVPLGFDINFFGLEFSRVYVNNNGNVTFDGPQYEYVPYDLTLTQRQIIAPFFTDVDTRCDGLPVTYGMDTVDGNPAFGVNWVEVNEFSCSSRPGNLNSFQLVLVSRSDIAPGAFDIEMNYDRIIWDHGNVRAGFANGTTNEGTFFEIPGSGVSDAFLDSNTNTGLIHNSIRNPVSGRYVFPSRGGDVTAPSVARFPICLSRPTSVAVAMDFATQNGTALVGFDYQSANGTLLIRPGQVCGLVRVATIDDESIEPPETFGLVLSNPVRATLANDTGVATILDDDGDEGEG